MTQPQLKLADMRHTWPDDAQCVVTITIDYDGPSNDLAKNFIPLGKYSHGRYSHKCGVPRYLAMLERQQIPATFFVPGYDAELYPDSVKSIAAAGHEIAAHGYIHESFDVGEREPELLRKSHGILTDLIGKPPVGWRNPGGGKSDLTLRTLTSLGYIYDSSEKDDDFPFFPEMDGKPLRNFINLPDNTSSLDDFPFYKISLTPPSEVLEHWKQEFHATYQEKGFYDLIVHPRTGFGSGSPTRAGIVEDLIIFMKSYPGVKFMTLEALARWCLAHPGYWRG